MSLTVRQWIKRYSATGDYKPWQRTFLKSMVDSKKSRGLTYFRVVDNKVLGSQDKTIWFVIHNSNR